MTSDELTRLETLIRSGFDAVDTRFDGIDARLDGMDVRLDGMDTRFDAMDTRFDAMDSRLDTMEANHDSFARVAANHFAQLHARTGRIEIGLEALSQQIKTVAEGVTSNGQRIDRLSERVDGVDELVRELAGLRPESA